MMMKKLPLCAILMMASALSAIAMPSESTNECDSVNIPVFLVDGVEVPGLDSIEAEDIVKIEIIKDTAITKYFRPRLGGLVLVTTKSKKYLKPLLEKNKMLTEEQKKKRIPGELRIR